MLQTRRVNKHTQLADTRSLSEDKPSTRTQPCGSLTQQPISSHPYDIFDNRTGSVRFGSTRSRPIKQASQKSEVRCSSWRKSTLLPHKLFPALEPNGSVFYYHNQTSDQAYNTSVERIHEAFCTTPAPPSRTEPASASMVANTHLSLAHLPNRLKLERVKSVSPALNTLLIIHTLESRAATRPERALRPLT
jgi:hypothetical protein